MNKKVAILMFLGLLLYSCERYAFDLEFVILDFANAQTGEQPLLNASPENVALKIYFGYTKTKISLKENRNSEVAYAQIGRFPRVWDRLRDLSRLISLQCW